MGGIVYETLLSTAQDNYSTTGESIELDTGVVTCEQLRKAFEDVPTLKRLENLSNRFAETIFEETQAGGLAVLTGPSKVKYAEAVDYLQEKMNVVNPDFGNVLKEIVTKIPAADWVHLRRTVQVPGAVSLTAKRDVDVAIDFVVKRPHNYLSWAGGNHYALADESGEVLAGVLRGNGPAAAPVPLAADFNFTANVITKAYGPKTFTIHLLDGAAGLNTLVSADVKIDIGYDILAAGFTTLVLADNATLDATLQLLPVYSLPTYAGFVKAIEAYIHTEGSPARDGTVISIDPRDGGAQVISIAKPSTGSYVVSARIVTATGHSIFTESPAIAIRRAVPPPSLDIHNDVSEAKTTALDSAAAVETAEHPKARLGVVLGDVAKYHTEITKLESEISVIEDDPKNHKSDSLTNNLLPPKQVVVNSLYAQVHNMRNQLAHASVEHTDTVGEHAALVATREGDHASVNSLRTQVLLEDIRDAVDKPVTVGDFYKLLQRRSYNLPLNSGTRAASEWGKILISPADQTWAVANRDKLRVFLEKKTLERNEPVTGAEFIRLLHESISSHMPSVIRSAESSFRAPDRSLLRAKTRGIGRPFMKSRKLRLRLA